MDQNREYVTLICPYCGTRQSHYLERKIGPQIVLCDIDDVPGCDRYFAVTLRVVHKIEYYAMNEADEHEDCTDQRLKMEANDG